MKISSAIWGKKSLNKKSNLDVEDGWICEFDKVKYVLPDNLSASHKHCTVDETTVSHSDREREREKDRERQDTAKNDDTMCGDSAAVTIDKLT